MIELPKDAYNKGLLHWVYSLNVNKQDINEWELLKKVCTCYLFNGDHPFQIDKLIITDSDKFAIEEREYIHSENIEIRARFIDVAIRSGLYRNQKLDLKHECSDLYLSLAEKLHEPQAFVRSILVRDVRTLWDEAFVNRVLAIVRNEDYNPHWLVVISDRIKSNLGLNCSAVMELLGIYEDRLMTDKSNDYQWQLQYVEMQLCFCRIDKMKAHQMRGLVHEAEGDYTIAHKEPNTFYPNLHQIFQDAFNEIDQVKDKYPNDWERIHNKLVIEKKEFVEMLSLIGVHTKFEVSEDFQEQVRAELLPQMKFNNPMDVLLLIMNTPCFSAFEETVMNIRKRWSQESPLLAICFNMAQVNSEGNTVGVNKEDAGFHVQVHQFLRMHTLFYLWTIVEHFHCLHLELEEEKVFGLLQSKNSKYVDHNQLILWTKGICSILNGEPLLGSYILMPQVESIIRKLAEDNLGDMTKMDKELQFEETFGNVLNKLKSKMSEAMNDELRLFFVDGCGVNLRNEMLHGLIENPMQVQKHSVYLLFFALNLFFREDKFLFES